MNDWIDLIRDYIHLEELDRPTLLKLVQKNVVSKKYKVDGKTHRDI